MASKKQRRANIREPLLMVYVGICVIAVVLTVVIAFNESNSSTLVSQTVATVTRTTAPIILTQQAEGSVNQDEHPGQVENSVSSTPKTKATETPKR